MLIMPPNKILGYPILRQWIVYCAQSAAVAL